MADPVITGLLRLKDELTPHLNIQVRALSGLQAGFVKTESVASKHFAQLQQSGQAAAQAIAASFKKVSGAVQAPGDYKKFAQSQQNVARSLEGLNRQSTLLEKSVRGTAVGFGLADRASAQFAQQTARLSQKLLGLHVVTSTLKDKFGTEGVGRAVSTTSDALMAFGSIVTVLPNKVGLAVGAIAAAWIFLQGLMRPNEKARQAFELGKKQIQSVRSKREELAEQAERAQITEAVKNSTGMPINELEKALTEQRRLLEKAVLLRQELALLAKHDTGTRAWADKRASLFNLLEMTEALLGDVTFSIEELKRAAADTQAVDTFAQTIKELNKNSRLASDALDEGLTTPLEEATEQLAIMDAQMKALLAVKDQLKPGEFEHFRELFIGGRDAQVARVEAAKTAEGEKENRNRQELERKREQELQALKNLENVWSEALPMAVAGFVDTMKTARDFLVEGFQSTQGAMTNAFETLLSGGRAKNALKQFLKDLKSGFLRAISEMMSQAVMKQAAGLGIAAATTSAYPAVATVDPRFAAAGAGSGSPAGGGVNLSSSGGATGAFGLDGGTTAAIGGILAGGAIAAGGIKSGNVGQGIAGGALAGLSLGMAAGPVGALAGLVVGAVLAGVLSSRAKRKAKKKQRAAEAAARAVHEAAVERARIVIKHELRSRYGQGLATDGAAGAIGALFSGGLSQAEVESFGNPASMAAQGTEAQQVNLDGITIHATLGPGYTAEQLADDLAYHLKRKLEGTGVAI